MRRVRSALPWLVGCALAGTLAGAVSVRAADAPPALAPLARSAQAVLEAGRTPEGLVLHLKRADQTALAVSELTASIDGQSAAVQRRADGDWLIALPRAAHPAALQVIAAHDGIREIFIAQLSPAPVPAAAANSGGLLHGHQQMAWWVLNIAVVLIAAIAISRRVS
jgi:hypothetical protein